MALYRSDEKGRPTGGVQGCPWATTCMSCQAILMIQGHDLKMISDNGLMCWPDSVQKPVGFANSKMQRRLRAK